MKKNLVEKYLGEATFIVHYPQMGSKPGQTRMFPTLEKAKQEAQKASMKFDGYVTVTRNGIEVAEYYEGNER